MGAAFLLALWGLALLVNAGGMAEAYLRYGRILPPGSDRTVKNARFSGLAMMVFGLATGISIYFVTR